MSLKKALKQVRLLEKDLLAERIRLEADVVHHVDWDETRSEYYVTEPDSSKRDDARKKLEEIFKNSEWGMARSYAGKVLGREEYKNFEIENPSFFERIRKGAKKAATSTLHGAVCASMFPVIGLWFYGIPMVSCYLAKKYVGNDIEILALPLSVGLAFLTAGPIVRGMDKLYEKTRNY